MRISAALTMILICCAACVPVSSDPYMQRAAADGAIIATQAARNAQATSAAILASAAESDAAATVAVMQQAVQSTQAAIVAQQTQIAMAQTQTSFEATATAAPAQATASATAALGAAIIKADNDALEKHKSEFLLEAGTAIFWLVMVAIVLLMIVAFPFALKVSIAWANAKSDELKRRSLTREGPGGLALVFFQNTYIPAFDAARLIEHTSQAQPGPIRMNEWKQVPSQKKIEETIPIDDFIQDKPVTRNDLVKFAQDMRRAGDPSSNIIPGWRKMVLLEEPGYWHSNPWQNVVKELKRQGLVDTDPSKNTMVINGTLNTLATHIFRNGAPVPQIEYADF